MPDHAETNAGYTIGAGDEVTIAIEDAEELREEFSRAFVVDSDGALTIPMVGRIKVAGVPVSDLQDRIRQSLTKYIRDPHVYVNVKALHSQPISVLGAVNSAGVHQVTGPRTLAEALAMAGGLTKEAGAKISITRQRRWGMIPLSSAVWDASGEYSVAEVRTKELTDAGHLASKLQVKPNDVINVSRSELVYVIGEVRRPGGFTMGERRNVSVLEALSLAEGTTRTAAPSKARILRPVAGKSERVEIRLDLKDVLKGRSSDLELSANDILFVPDNAGKRIAMRTAEAALQTVSGILIWRGF